MTRKSLEGSAVSLPLLQPPSTPTNFFQLTSYKGGKWISTPYPATFSSFATKIAFTILSMEEDIPNQAESCEAENSSTDHVALAEASVTANKRFSSSGDCRNIMAARALLGIEPKAQAEGCLSLPAPIAYRELSPAVTPKSGRLLDVTREVYNQSVSTEDAAGTPESEAWVEVVVGEDDGSVSLELNAEGMRHIAIRALAAVPEQDDQPAESPSTPLQKAQNDETAPTASNPASPSLVSPPQTQEQARSPLRSPCWRTLMPVVSPPGGYWKPRAMEKGQKNSPMCGPCTSGKKGRCFGGLPCDRCIEKGYTKARCEGSVVFRFSPRQKALPVNKEMEQGGGVEWKIGKSVKSGRWKRDAFGRFA